MLQIGTINSKINGTPKDVYLSISQLHSILAVANLLAHNNLWLCYYGQVNSVRLKYNVASKWASKNHWGIPFILLLMVHMLRTEISIFIPRIEQSKQTTTD